MKDIDGKYIYFSNIGINTSNSYVLRNYNNNISNERKKFLRSNFFKKINKETLKDEDDKDSLLKEDIFDISYNKKYSNKTIKEKNNRNNSTLNDDIFKLKYKYHKIHLKKLKDLKRDKLLKSNEIKNLIIYEPNIDYIKKRIIIGPKWENMIGREEPKILNTSLIITQKKDNQNFPNKKTENINNNNNTFIVHKNLKDKIKLNDKDLFKRKNIAKIPLKKGISSSVLNKSNKEKKIKHFKSFSADKLKKDNLKTNFNINLKSKIYFIDNSDIITKRFVSDSKTIETQKKINKINNNIKKRKYKFIGLNNEELKIINDIKKNKKMKFNKIDLRKKDNIQNNKIEKYKEKENNKAKSFQKRYIYNDVYNDFINKKSFNSFIIKSLLNFKQNNTLLNNLNKNKSFKYKIKRLNKFYNYDCDKISIYSHNKFDNITYKSNTK